MSKDYGKICFSTMKCGKYTNLSLKNGEKKEILSKNCSKNAIFIQRLQKKHKLCQTICGKKRDIRQKIMRKTRISLRDHNKNVNFVTGLLLKYKFHHRIVVKCQFLQKITKKIL